MPPEPLITTVKEMAQLLGKSRFYVTDMRRGGFKLPATLAEAKSFLQTHGPPTRFRRCLNREHRRPLVARSLPLRPI